MREELWQARADRLAPMLLSGMTFSDVARLANISQQTVSRYAGLIGVASEKAESRTKGHVERRLEEIRQQAAAGKTRAEAADELGISLSTVVKYATEHRIEFIHASAKRAAQSPRSEAMASMFMAGKTLAEIGDLYGITRERVRQLIKKHHGLVGADGGSRANAERKRAVRETKKDAKALDRYGCTQAQYLELLAIGKAMRAEGASFARCPTGAYASQRSNSLKRGIEWNLKLWDWWQLWLQSGKWDQRGLGKDLYVMCRFGDVGPYEIGNVYIATLSHNAVIQPNNPYRKGHPDHEKVMASVARNCRPSRGPRPKKSGLPVGVCRHKRGFVAQISINGRNKYLGHFKCPDDAARAYQRALASLSAHPAVPASGEAA